MVDPFLIFFSLLFYLFEKLIAFLGIWKSRIEGVTVVEIGKSHFSYRKIVHIMTKSIPPISVAATENSKHWITIKINYVKVNYDITGFRDGVDCISHEEILILFS